MQLAESVPSVSSSVRKVTNFAKMDGDQSISVPSPNTAIERFMVKLGKALFYRHTGGLFDGDLYVRHIDSMQRNVTPESVEAVFRFAPDIMRPGRGTRSLADQFIYRFNASTQYGVVYAVVQFSEQMIFQIMAVSHNMATTLAETRAASGKEIRAEGLVRAPLKHRARAAK